MWDRQSVEALQCLAYIGRTRKNITHAGNGREVHFAGVLNVKVDCTVYRQGKSLSISGASEMGVFACPIDTNTFVTLRELC